MEGFRIAATLHESRKRECLVPFAEPVKTIQDVPRVMVTMSRQARDEVFITRGEEVNTNISFTTFNERNKEFFDICTGRDEDADLQDLADFYQGDAILVLQGRGKPADVKAPAEVFIGQDAIRDLFYDEGEDLLERLTIRPMRLHQENDETVVEIGRAFGSKGRPYCRVWCYDGSNWYIRYDMQPLGGEAVDEEELAEDTDDERLPLTWEFIQTHLSEDHSDSLLAFMSHYGGVDDAQKATVTHVDLGGFKIMAKLNDGTWKSVHIPFEDVQEIQDIPKVLVKMSDEARNAVYYSKGKYIHPEDRVKFATFNDLNKQIVKWCVREDADAMAEFYAMDAILVPQSPGPPRAVCPILKGPAEIKIFFEERGAKLLKTLTLRTMRIHQSTATEVTELGRAFGSTGWPYVREWKWNKESRSWLIHYECMPTGAELGDGRTITTPPVEQPPWTWTSIQDMVNTDHREAMLAIVMHYGGIDDAHRAVLTNLDQDALYIGVDTRSIDGEEAFTTQNVIVVYSEVPIFRISDVPRAILAMYAIARNEVFFSCADEVIVRVHFEEFDERNKAFAERIHENEWEMLGGWYMRDAVLVPQRHGPPQPRSPIIVGREAITSYIVDRGPRLLKGLTHRATRLYQLADTKVTEVGCSAKKGVGGRPYLREWHKIDGEWLIKFDCLPL
eukprot:TRINITY_DN54891_c0_g1_i1.p1 TRINITY_DN54891_c0_g1~~TRINITY_DN54891_c0_g1_i1.p1  ORF type:complete len:763 (+),score=155.37 TRINITY_DN54891_c0_g1_i1:273-2291(+)